MAKMHQIWLSGAPPYTLLWKAQSDAHVKLIGSRQKGLPRMGECRQRIQWCSPRDQGLGLEAPRGQKWVLVLVLDHEVLVLVFNIWSWSRSWRKSSSFSRLLLSFLTAVSKAHHDILWETTKTVCHSEAIVWENLLCSMHISLSW